MKEYQVVNGTSYDFRTQIEVMQVLEKARLNRTRLHISLGDVATGRDWLEEFECFGFVLVLDDERFLLVDILRDGQTQASFQSVASAMRYVQKLGLALA